jgi:hypothetical protein
VKLPPIRPSHLELQETFDLRICLESSTGGGEEERRGDVTCCHLGVYLRSIPFGQILHGAMSKIARRSLSQSLRRLKKESLLATTQVRIVLGNTVILCQAECAAKLEQYVASCIQNEFRVAGHAKIQGTERHLTLIDIESSAFSPLRCAGTTLVTSWRKSVWFVIFC